MIKNYIILSIIFLCCSILISAQNKPLHAPAEIFKIMEASELTYEISDDYEPVEEKNKYPVLSNQLCIKVDSDGNRDLTKYEISSEAKELMDEGEKFFQKKNTEEARKYYLMSLEKDPNYSYLYTLIADCFFIESQYDSAKVYFKKAIELNFVDYNAHWFLADTYLKDNMPDSALHEFTIAHLLNINHKNMLKLITKYREKAGREWNPRENFEPQYSLSKDGNKVEIKTKSEWLGYAMVKAVWKYEPGYAEDMIGKTSDSTFISTTEEKEALTAYMVGNENDEQLKQIVEDRYLEEFIMYEVIGKRYPTALLLLSSAKFGRLVEYVNKYY